MDKKMLIESFEDPGLKKDKKIFNLQLNPESYSTNYQIVFAKKQATGSSSNPLKFSKIRPRKLDFEFLFDETGAVEGNTNSELGVDQKINELKAIALSYHGKKHRTRYLKLRWGNLLFKCCLESLDVSYKVFNKKGVPLRATVRANFIEFQPNKLMVKKQNDQSPDITHMRKVKEGDTLQQLANEIYGDPKYYLAVARANRIFKFRKLEPGTAVYFPPIEK